MMEDERLALIDPEGKYDLTDEQKLFIVNYINYRDIVVASNFTGIDKNKGKSYFLQYAVQQEIRRLNMELIRKQFAQKMMSVEQIGGWLTNLITEENLPEADRINTKTKIEVAKLLLQVDAYKKKAFDDPSIVINQDFEDDIGELGIDDIKKLISGKGSNLSEKERLMESLPGYDDMTKEDKRFLETLSVDEIRNLIEDIKGGR